METGYPSRRAGSFGEIGIRLILYAKKCLSKRALTTECTYVILAWHVTQKEVWNQFLCVLIPKWFQIRI